MDGISPSRWHWTFPLLHGKSWFRHPRRLVRTYLKSGVATRVHFNKERVGTSLSSFALDVRAAILGDCLYRFKNHATWILPSIDIDEYINMKDGSVLKVVECLRDYLGLSWDAIVKNRAPTQHSSLNGVQHLSFCASSTRTAGNFVGSPRAAESNRSVPSGEPELARHDLRAVHVLEEWHAELGPLRHLGRSSLPTPSWLCNSMPIAGYIETYRNQCHGYLDATVRSRIITVPRSPFSWGNNAFLEAPEFSGSSADETIHPSMTLWCG